MINFSKHAIERMEQRRITSHEVRAVLENYTKAEPYSNGFRLFGKVGSRQIVVGINQDDQGILVATVFEKE